MPDKLSAAYQLSPKNFNKISSVPDLHPNQWPPEDILPGFRKVVERWLNEVTGLANRLMGLLALSLELDHDYFERTFGDERMSLTKLIRYPATLNDAFGVNAHHDTGFLTILAPGGSPG